MGSRQTDRTDRYIVRCRYNTVNFLQNYHDRHPILFWVRSLIYVLLLSSQRRMQYRDELNHVKTATRGTFWLHSLLSRSVGCQRRGVNVHSSTFNTLRPRQDGRHFPDDTFKRIFMNENVRISINISLKFVPMSLINKFPSLVQIMAWRRLGDKPLSEAMMVNLLTHICVTRLQWVNSTWDKTNQHNTILFLYVERRMVVVTNHTCTDNFNEFVPCVWELRYVSKKYHRWILRIAII